MSNAAKFYIVPAVLYAVVANPATYQATRNVFGSWVATSEGTAKMGGLILHAIVFILLATLAMRYFPGKNAEDYRTGGLIRQGASGSMVHQASNGAMVGSVLNVSPMSKIGKEF
jgi:hypothetical protein